jgi:PIN domain nuclease of toxin-antitoxin system
VKYVLDASALLAYLHGEPGQTRVEAILAAACICSVNWSEVIQKSLAKNVDVRGMREDFVQMGLKIAAYTPLQAELAGRLWNETRRFGLSLADRSCFALALDKSLPVLTADRAWADLDLGVNVEVLR